MRYHFAPETDVPAQVALYEPPSTVATARTRVPAGQSSPASLTDRIRSISAS